MTIKRKESRTVTVEVRADKLDHSLIRRFLQDYDHVVVYGNFKGKNPEIEFQIRDGRVYGMRAVFVESSEQEGGYPMPAVVVQDPPPKVANSADWEDTQDWTEPMDGTVRPRHKTDAVAAIKRDEDPRYLKRATEGTA